MLFQLFFLVIGLLFGSFFAALSWRMPRDISIVKGRSMCPNCKKQIEWYDNLPLISYIFLRGKCRNCKKPISARYFLIEAATALCFYFVAGVTTSPIHLLYMLFVASVLILIFVIDFEHQIIPDILVFWGVGITLLKLIIVDNAGIFQGLLAGVLAALFLLIIHIITKGRGMGLGDVKFAIFGGLFIGIKLLPVWLFLAFLTGALVGIILILTKAAKLKDKIAFGPFLIIGLVAAYFWGSQIFSIIFLS